MVLHCHMKGNYLKIVFITLVGVNNSDSFMVKTQAEFLKSCIIAISIMLRLVSLRTEYI